MTLYKVIKCKECQRLNITTAKERVRCMRCNKFTLMVKRKPLYESTNPENARQFMNTYNKELIDIKNAYKK